MPDDTPGKLDPYLRAATLDELLQWHDLDFVRSAFVTLLGRRPDPEGEDYYVRQLRNGTARTKLLWQLRRSTEGQAHDPGIAGLDRALRQAAWGRVPVVGWLARRAFGGEADSPAARRRRALENEMGALRRQLVALSEERAAAPTDDVTAAAAARQERARARKALSPTARQCFDIMTNAGDHADPD